MDKKYDYRQLREIINANHDRFSELNYDNSFSMLQKTEAIAEWFKVILKEYNVWIDYIDNFIEKFDENLYTTLEDVMNAWYEGGLLAELVRVAINEEVLKARVYKNVRYPNLKTRLDTQYDTLEKNIGLNKTDILNLFTSLSSKVDKNGNGQITKANLSQEVLTLMTGDRVAVVGEDSVNSVNIVTGAVNNRTITPNGLPMDSTNYASGYNLFYATDLLKGLWVPEDGTQLVEIGSARLIFMKAKKGRKYTITKTGTTNAFVIGSANGKTVGSACSRIYSNALVNKVTITFDSNHKYLFVGVSSSGETCDVSITEESIVIGNKKIGESGIGFLITENPIEIDWLTNKIKITGSARLSQSNKDILLANASGIEIDFSQYVSSNVIYFFYDLDTDSVSVIPYNGTFPTNSILFAVVRITGRQIWTTAEVKNQENTVSINDNRFILPDTLYMMEGEDYTIHTNNIIFDKYENSSIYGEISSLSGIQQFEKSVTLKNKYPVTLTSKVVLKANGSNNIIRKTFDMVTAAKKTTYKTPTILMIGDSTTQTNMPATVKWWLSKWGYNSNMVGTIVDKRDEFGFGMKLNGEKGEGRGGWRLAEMLNDAYLTTGERFIPPGNPFIDTNNNWSFEHYVETNNLQNIDFVHFQMGTNDIIPYSVFKSEMGYDVELESFETSLANLPVRLKKMINNIHSYNPNIKIAINPPMVAGLNEEFNKKSIRYAEIEQYELKGLPNVYCLPSYASIGTLSVAGGYASSGTKPYDKNDTITDVISNNVHPDGMGQLANGLWVASWIANMI